MDRPQTQTAVAEKPASQDEPIVVFDHVSLSFDDAVVLRDVSFTLRRGHTKIILERAAPDNRSREADPRTLRRMRPYWVNGQRVDEYSRANYEVRADIGMVFHEERYSTP